MSKHTPGPWVADTLGVFGLIREERWGVYANGAAIGARMPAECGGPEASANARRIVACVNACAGISTEALEDGALEYVRNALRPVVQTGQVPHGGESNGNWSHLAAALAKLEGKS